MQVTTTLRGPSGPIASSVRWARRFRDRRRGVRGHPPLRPGDALVIVPCRQVHTSGVGYELDVVFCDRDDVVLHVETLGPRRRSRRVARARYCVELPGGRAVDCGIVPGVRLVFE